MQHTGIEETNEGVSTVLAEETNKEFQVYLVCL